MRLERTTALIASDGKRAVGAALSREIYARKKTYELLGVEVELLG